MKWGEVDGTAIQGQWKCSNSNIDILCNFYSSDSNSNFMETLEHKYHQYSKKFDHLNYSNDHGALNLPCESHRSISS
jgi:hypothetical protein